MKRRTRIRRVLPLGSAGKSWYFFLTDTVGVEDALDSVGFGSIDYEVPAEEGRSGPGYCIVGRDSDGNTLGLRRLRSVWELTLRVSSVAGREAARRFIDLIGACHATKLFDAQGVRYEIRDRGRGIMVDVPGKAMTLVFRNGDAVISYTGARAHAEEEEELTLMIHHIIGGSIIVRPGKPGVMPRET